MKLHHKRMQEEAELAHRINLLETREVNRRAEQLANSEENAALHNTLKKLRETRAARLKVCARTLSASTLRRLSLVFTLWRVHCAVRVCACVAWMSGHGGRAARAQGEARPRSQGEEGQGVGIRAHTLTHTDRTRQHTDRTRHIALVVHSPQFSL